MPRIGTGAVLQADVGRSNLLCSEPRLFGSLQLPVVRGCKQIRTPFKCTGYMQCIHGADGACLQNTDGGPDDRSIEVDDDRVADIVKQALLRLAIEVAPV